MLRAVLLCTNLIFSNFFVATTGDETWHQSHVFGESHAVFAETTVLVAEGLAFPVGIPVVMGLIVSMVLVEGVVQVTVDPGSLGNMT
jgi:hypothetical protein